MPGGHDDPYALPPEVETARLRDLDQLHVLDTPPEDRFAHITRMARVALGVPMSAINLMDRDRQWCKQFSADHELHFDVPRDESVCRATIARAYQEADDPALVYEDLSESEFAELPTIAADGGVRFYAGFPLFGPRGQPVGTFCVYDTVPRKLNDQERATFVELAAWAQRELKSSDDLQRAADVQHQLLPPPMGDLPGYTLATAFEPAFSVAGDFYDHYPVQGGINLTVADVMGKGLGPAIVAANVRSAMRAAATSSDKAGHALDLSAAIATVGTQLDEDLTRTGTFVTLFHCSVDTMTGTVHYFNGGHGIAAVLRHNGQVEALKGDNLPLGVSFGDAWLVEQVVLDRGDMLFIASDGLLDILGDNAEVDDAFAFLARHPDPTQLSRAVSTLARQIPPVDDVTILALRRDDGEPA